MIILNVYYTANDGMREEYLRTVAEAGIPEKSRAEAGNARYEYYLSESNPDEVLLVEHWKDEDAYQFHKEQDYFELLQNIKKKYVKEVHIDSMVL